MRSIPLDPGLDGRRVARLRALTGADEAAVETGTIALLDRLLVAEGGTAVPPGMAARLAVSDRDRLLAEVLRELAGDRIEADVTCLGCRRAFALRFALSALIDARRGHRPDGVERPDARGCYRLHGITFRLPCTADLECVLLLPKEERWTALLSACVLAGPVEGREQIVETAMAALGPTLDLDLDTTCPHCGERQAPRFSIAGYLLKSLANERRFLLREVHRIARVYGWSYDSIMALPRRDRHDFIRLIDSDGSHVRRPVQRAEMVR